MKTYCLIAAAITVIFATAANATPRPEQGAHHGDRSHRQQDDKRQHNTDRGHAKDYGDRSQVAKNRNDHRQDNHRRDGDRGHSQHRRVEKKHVVKQHRAPHNSRREQHRNVYKYNTHAKKHHSRNDVNWLINVDLGSYYSEPAYPSHRIYYQRRQGGQCFRVEERSDRTVWVEVPYYKCS